MEDWPDNFNKYTENLLEDIASYGTQSAADGLAGMIGKECLITDPEIHVVDILDIPKWLGRPEEEVVGVYLRVWAELPVQFILLLTFEQALDLADMLLEKPPGTTTQLDALSQSALAEVGNLTGSLFLNVMSSVSDISLRPSPPGVMIDMLGAILNVIIASMDDLSQRVLMFQTAFVFPEQHSKVDFWVIPASETIQSLIASTDVKYV